MFPSECTKYERKSDCPRVCLVLTRYGNDIAKGVIAVDELCKKCEWHKAN